MEDTAARVADETAIAKGMTGEIFMALGLSKTGLVRRATGWLFMPIARRFARMWARFDADYAQYGLGQAAQNLAAPLVKEVKTRGAENIPAGGPLIVASNHPGAYDSAAIISNIPHPGLKVIVSDIPEVELLPHVRERAIFARGDTASRTQAVRAGIRHLREGGALMIFPTGLVDPDPDLWADAGRHLDDWSPSLEIFLRRAPETRLVVAIASGVISPRWAAHPLTRLGRDGHERRRLAEFMQVIAQLMRPGRDLYTTRLSFAPPLSLDDLGGPDGPILQNIIARAKALLAEHMTWR